MVASDYAAPTFDCFFFWTFSAVHDGRWLVSVFFGFFTLTLDYFFQVTFESRDDFLFLGQSEEILRYIFFCKSRI